MYIGSTGARGLHHLVYEVVDNSVDEALAGRNDKIEVTLHPDNSVTVRDFGSGIPVDRMEDQGMSALTVVLTKLHAGGKFGGEDAAYKVSGGLHGVGESVEFHYEGGIRDFVAHVNSTKDAIHKRIVFFEGENEQGQVEVAMQWNGSYQESVYTFANNINTHEGGSHLSGFNAALTRTLNKVARDMNLLKEKEENLEGDDVREGLAAVVSVKLQDPQFEGQTKTKLRNHRIVVMTDADVDGAHIRTLVLTFLYRHMPELFERGHVYIAVPPLYLVRLGGQQTYLERDTELEELLVRQRFGSLAVAARDGLDVKLTEARYARFSRALAEYEGWSARLRA